MILAGDNANALMGNMFRPTQHMSFSTIIEAKKMKHRNSEECNVCSALQQNCLLNPSTGSVIKNALNNHPSLHNHGLCLLMSHFLQWLRELNAAQLKKAHANNQNTCELRKQLHQFGCECLQCTYFF